MSIDAGQSSSLPTLVQALRDHAAGLPEIDLPAAGLAEFWASAGFGPHSEIDEATAIPVVVLRELWRRVLTPWFICDEEGRILLANPAYEQVMGAIDSSAPVFLTDLIEEPKHHLRALLRAVTSGGRTNARLETRVRTPDESELDVQLSLQQLNDPSGTNLLLVRMQDVTAQRRAERAHALLLKVSSLLASSLDVNETLVNVARATVPTLADWCTVTLKSEDGTVRELAAAYGDAEREQLAQTLRERYPYGESRQTGLTRVLQTGEPALYQHIQETDLVTRAYDTEHLRALRLLGTRSAMIVPLVMRGRVEGALSLMSVHRGRRYGLEDLSVATELAGLCALALENARLVDQLRQAIRARSELLAHISHDLKNAVSAIKLRAELVKEELLSADHATSPGSKLWGAEVAKIEGGATRLLRSLNDLVEAGRLQLGHTAVLHRAPVDLCEIAGRLVAEYQEMTNRHQVRLTAGSGSVVGYWDPTLLERAIGNLLNNAIKYSPAGGQVCLTIACSEIGGGRTAVLTIADEGIGIPEEDQARVFEAFQRAENAEHLTGTGVGLASVAIVVKLHGGTIRLESREGEGTTIVLTLPMDEPTPSEEDV